MNNKLVEQKFKDIKNKRFLSMLNYSSSTEYWMESGLYLEFIDFDIFIELLKEYEEYLNSFIEKENFSCFIKSDENCCYIFSYISEIDIYDTIEIEDFLAENKIDTSWNNYIIAQDISCDLNSDLFEIIEYNLKKCLILLKLNDNIKNRFLNIENKYMNKIRNLINMKCSDLIDIYYDDFKEVLIKYICENQSEFYEKDKEILSEKLELFFNDKLKCIDYYKLLFTHKLVNKYTLGLIHDKVDFIDYSFAILPLYKLVEVTLFNLIKVKYSNDYIYISGEKYKVSEVDKHKMMLKIMKSFLEKKGFFKNSDSLHNYIIKLESWIEEDRNGYVHKDIMKIESYDSIDINSINLFCMIIYNL